MPSGIPECHVTISLKRDGSCIHIFFRFIGEKGVSVRSEKEQCDFETCRRISHDKWKCSKSQGKWKEISAEMDALGSALKEKSRAAKKTPKENQNYTRW